MHWILALLGVIFILMPIAYTFLRLTTKIGPENTDGACALGILLWIFGLLIGFILIAQAYKIWPGLMH